VTGKKATQPSLLMAITKDHRNQAEPDFQKRSLRCASLTWIIDDFRRRREKHGFPIISDAFSCEESENESPAPPGTDFQVYFYPNGAEDPDMTSCYLMVNSTTYECVKARFAVSILDKNGDLKVKKVFKDPVRGSRCGTSVKMGWSKFYPRRKILDSLSQILKNGHITLVIDVYYLDQDVDDDHINAIFALSPLFAPKSKSGSEDFKSLFEGKNFDICLKLRDKNIPAHRVVLSTSQVIEKSLIRDRRTFFVMEDFDSDVMADAVFFMYYRGFESHSVNFKNMLRFADQYRVPALKFACEQELYETVCCENVVQLFDLAIECSSSILVDALKFIIIDNIDAVLRTKGWHDALSSNHSLVTRLVQFLGQQLSKRKSSP